MALTAAQIETISGRYGFRLEGVLVQSAVIAANAYPDPATALDRELRISWAIGHAKSRSYVDFDAALKQARKLRAA